MIESIVPVASDKVSTAAYQYHYRGILSQEARQEIKRLWGDRPQRAELIDRFELVVPRKGVRFPVRDLDTGKKAKDYVRKATPNDPLDFLYHIGSLHGDLRIKYPSRDFAFGWTLDVGKAGLQHVATGTLTPVFEDRFLSCDTERMIVAEPKTIMETKWLRIVTPERPSIYVPPQDSSRPASAMTWVFMGFFDILFGVQKHDYLEYFIAHRTGQFPRCETLRLARFLKIDVKYVQGLWQTHLRPDAWPYAWTHVLEVERLKAQKENGFVIWNGEVTSKLWPKSQKNLCRRQ